MKVTKKELERIEKLKWTEAKDEIVEILEQVNVLLDKAKLIANEHCLQFKVGTSKYDGLTRNFLDAEDY